MSINSLAFFVLSDNQKKELLNFLEIIKCNPYKNYLEFHQEIDYISEKYGVPESFLNICEYAKKRSYLEKPVLLIKNCPIDKELPIFDFENPVESKYKLKKTFIAESLLQLYAKLTNNYAIGYKNVNNGDVFQDIYPMKKLQNSQSQKTLISIGFHKDLANHFVRPDWVNIICMRSNRQNKVYTTFASNKDIIDCLSNNTIKELSQIQFDTPYDDLSVYGDTNNELGKTGYHAVLYNKNNIAYFEGRTVGVNKNAQDALKEFNSIIHKVKFSINMQPGYFVSIANNECIHGKENIHISDIESQRIRWMIKTVNINNLMEIKNLMVEHNNNYVVNG